MGWDGAPLVCTTTTISSTSTMPTTTTTTIHSTSTLCIPHISTITMLSIFTSSTMITISNC